MDTPIFKCMDKVCRGYVHDSRTSMACGQGMYYVITGMMGVDPYIREKMGYDEIKPEVDALFKKNCAKVGYEKNKYK